MGKALTKILKEKLFALAIVDHLNTTVTFIKQILF